MRRAVLKASLIGFLFLSTVYGQSAVPGKLLVRHRAGSAEAGQRAFASHRAKVSRHYAQIAVSEVDVPEGSEDQVKAELERTGLYQFVERDHYAHIGATPNDPNFASEWH